MPGIWAAPVESTLARGTCGASPTSLPLPPVVVVPARRLAVSARSGATFDELRAVRRRQAGRVGAASARARRPGAWRRPRSASAWTLSARAIRALGACLEQCDAGYNLSPSADASSATRTRAAQRLALSPDFLGGDMCIAPAALYFFTCASTASCAWEGGRGVSGGGRERRRRRRRRAVGTVGASTRGWRKELRRAGPRAAPAAMGRRSGRAPVDLALESHLEPIAWRRPSHPCGRRGASSIDESAPAIPSTLPKSFESISICFACSASCFSSSRRLHLALVGVEHAHRSSPIRSFAACSSAEYIDPEVGHRALFFGFFGGSPITLPSASISRSFHCDSGR